MISRRGSAHPIKYLDFEAACGSAPPVKAQRGWPTKDFFEAACGHFVQLSFTNRHPLRTPATYLGLLLGSHSYPHPMQNMEGVPLPPGIPGLGGSTDPLEAVLGPFPCARLRNLPFDILPSYIKHEDLRLFVCPL